LPLANDTEQDPAVCIL